MMNKSNTDMKAEVLLWLRKWERLINSQDFAEARSLFSNDVVSFGTFAELLTGLDDLEARQWRKIWPTIVGFTFDEPLVLVSEENPQTATVISLWHSQGKAGKDGFYQRRGRATLVLRNQKNGLRCIHSHLSMEPGIPPLHG
jgi:ketosteroid isomerase-like protein